MLRENLELIVLRNLFILNFQNRTELLEFRFLQLFETLHYAGIHDIQILRLALRHYSLSKYSQLPVYLLLLPLQLKSRFEFYLDKFISVCQSNITIVQWEPKRLWEGEGWGENKFENLSRYFSSEFTERSRSLPALSTCVVVCLPYS